MIPSSREDAQPVPLASTNAVQALDVNSNGPPEARDCESWHRRAVPPAAVTDAEQLVSFSGLMDLLVAEGVIAPSQRSRILELRTVTTTELWTDPHLRSVRDHTRAYVALRRNNSKEEN